MLSATILPAQPAQLTPSERSLLVNGVLKARVTWFEDHMRVDPCSVVAVTQDTAYLEHMDWRVRHLFIEGYPTDLGCRQLFTFSPRHHVQFVSVGFDGADRVVRLYEHGNGVGSKLYEYRAAAGREWSILISPPEYMNDTGVRTSPKPDSVPPK